MCLFWTYIIASCNIGNLKKSKLLTITKFFFAFDYDLHVKIHLAPFQEIIWHFGK